ncbi:MAG: ATP-grasp domain-containing protein [Dysgonomonas sp.]|nr:ATP-grasp domain-containing protein [Dysgonomonas sp.]
MTNANVLLLDGDGTQTLPIARQLYKNNYCVHMFYRDKLSYGYPTRYVSKKNRVLLHDDNAYLDFLKDYIIKNNIKVVIPLSDSKAEFVSKYKIILQSITSIFNPDYSAFNLGYDKNQLMVICQKNGFPHPHSIDLEQFDFTQIPNSIFPALIKPNHTTGGRGMVLVKDRDEFENSYPIIRANYGACHLQEFIEKGGKQIKVQLFVDEESKLQYSSVIHKQRYYPESGGSSCCNITIECPELVEICYSVLKKIKWIGFADFDLIEDTKDGIMKIMEINPRVPACIESAVNSGIDYGSIIVDASLGRKLKTYQYKPGKKLRHIGFEFLWFICSKDRFRAKPNWFKFIDKDLSFQDFSFSDPLPFFYGLIGNIKKQLSSEFRSTKTGIR